MATKKKNLDAHLAEIFKQFIAIKDEDYKRSQEVFKSVFEMIKLKMGEQCNYFRRYSSQILYAGSVYDGIKVSRLDEFDMDIVIRLPVNQLDDSKKGIILENDQPGYVKMKIIDSFDNMDKQPDWEECHVVTREWRDADKYFLQNKFRQWLQRVLQKALNEIGGKVTVNGELYVLTYKESGPAYTLNVRNDKNQDPFELDVDLVPVIKFLLPRWPEGYRKMEGTNLKEWLVVPKPNKAMKDESLKNRCWRLSFQDFEKDMMKNCQQLKTTIRLMKKLRDALEMKAIASYYIKTLFLWKITANDKKYWQTKLSILFQTMVKELHDAVERKNIPFFWHKNNNLIDTLKPTLQKIYSEKLANVLKSLEANDVDAVVAALLTTSELKEFKSSEFYQTIAEKTNKETAKDVKDGLLQYTTINKTVSPMNEEKIHQKTNITDELMSRLVSLEDRVKLLEMSAKTSKNGSLQLQAKSKTKTDFDKTIPYEGRRDEVLARLALLEERVKILEISDTPCANCVKETKLESNVIFGVDFNVMSDSQDSGVDVLIDFN